MRILVTGATGHVGRHVVTQLHAAGHEVRALTRTPATAGFAPGVEVVAGGLGDTSTLDDAFRSVDAVHLITFSGYEDLTNGAEIVALAERSGIRRVSVLGGWCTTSVERALASSSLAATIVAPKEFMGNALEWADEIRASRTVSLLASYRSAVVHEADIAAVAVTALTEDGHAGKSYLLTGPEALTPEERIRTLAEATGQDLTMVRLNEDEERARLRRLGYDDDYVEFGVRLATDPPAEAGVVLPTVETVTGRPAHPFALWARENAQRFQAAQPG